jgi:hypothetical protein
MALSRAFLVALAGLGQIAEQPAASSARAEQFATVVALAVDELRKKQRAAVHGSTGRVAADLTAYHLYGIRKKRQAVVRAADKWRGSTMFGYVYKNGDAVYKHNFRMTRKTVDRILEKLQAAGYFKDGQSRNPDLRVPGRFKLAVALYFFAQGTGYKAARPLYPLPHHHRLASACSRACSSRSPARPVHAPAPCCWPKLPISMPDEPAPPRAVSSTPRAIGRARALACLVRASGEESSALARRIAFASPPRPSQVCPTTPTSSATITRALGRRRWAAGGRRRRERRSTAAAHAARGCVRLRETGAKIAPGLVDEPGRPPAGFWDACIAVANVLRACTAL